MHMALRDILDMIFSVIKTAQPVDILDILVLSYVVYLGMKLIRETRAGQLIKGIFLLLFVYIIASWINMKAISYLLSETLNIGLIALIILFQPELRRTLEKAGYTKLGLRFSGSSNVDSGVWSRTIDVICDACVELSATSTGALIVIERQTRLGEQIDNGTILDAIPSKELFGNIFFNKTPLHDGAVIIRDGKILAAACFLPKPQKEELINKRLGSRHRAAIGMSENSDAIGDRGFRGNRCHFRGGKRRAEKRLYAGIPPPASDQAADYRQRGNHDRKGGTEDPVPQTAPQGRRKGEGQCPKISGRTDRKRHHRRIRAAALMGHCSSGCTRAVRQ